MMEVPTPPIWKTSTCLTVSLLVVGLGPAVEDGPGRPVDGVTLVFDWPRSRVPW